MVVIVNNSFRSTVAKQMVMIEFELSLLPTASSGKQDVLALG